MKKSILPLLCLPFLLCGVVSCGPTVSSSSSSVISGTSEVPPTSSTTPIPPVESTPEIIPDPTVFSNHAQYMDAEKGTLLLVKGVATYITPVFDGKTNVYLQDGEGGFYLFGVDSEVVIGKSYQAVGEKVVYNGCHELQSVHAVKEVSPALTQTNKDISALNFGDSDLLKEYMGAYVTLDNTIVQATPKVSDTKAYSIKVGIGDKAIDLRIDPKVVSAETFTALNELAKTLVVGNSFDIKGLLTAFGYSGKPAAQIYIVSLEGMVKQKLTPDAALDVAEFSIRLPKTVNYSTTSLTLLTASEDVTISWVSDNEAVISKAGVVAALVADTKVTLTATLKSGEVTRTHPYEILVIGTDVSKDVVLKATGFEEGTGGGQYGQSGIKESYALGEYALDGLTWVWNSALAGGGKGDLKNGGWAIRMKAEAGKDNFIKTVTPFANLAYIDFYAGLSGSSNEATLTVSTSIDNGVTWTPLTEKITVSNYALEYQRVYLNLKGEGLIKMTLETLNSATINLDDFRFVSRIA